MGTLPTIVPLSVTPPTAVTTTATSPAVVSTSVAPLTVVPTAVTPPTVTAGSMVIACTMPDVVLLPAFDSKPSASDGLLSNGLLSALCCQLLTAHRSQEV